MLFNSYEFIVFLVIVATAFYAVPFRLGKHLLVLASLVFYAWWDPRFLALILTCIVVNYAAAFWVQPSTNRHRKKVLAATLVFDLCLLGFFKYYNFFVGSFAGIFGLSPDSLILNIVLPVGISFYTFESISYVVDVYWGQLKPVRRLSDFALFISFFPHLVAGPIIRPRDFFPQISNWKTPTWSTIHSALVLVFLGLIKKIVFADQFALAADNYFNNAQNVHQAATAWAGVTAFTMQIYFDFSGYTDMARGFAKLFGFEFPINFARPYLSTSIKEFWRRWHISLSTWLRDYLYIPLGGNHGKWLTYRNLLFTMVLGGLWHGASWNFAIWGAYHGGLLAIHRYFCDCLRGTDLEKHLNQPWLAPLKLISTFILVMIGWVFFRAATLSDSIKIISTLFAGWSDPGRYLTSGLGIAVILSLVVGVFEEKKRIFDRLESAPLWARTLVCVTAFAALEFFSVTGEKIPFIYFQF